MTSERSRTIIRSHHRLHKQHAAALKEGDSQAAQKVAEAIEKNGGIQLYQAASKQGQANDRGGDSSKVLVDWLQALSQPGRKSIEQYAADMSPLRCLEIGALSTKNEISKYPKIVEVTRIDLNSQEAGITKQDFMDRPLPADDDERFDIISLSLVLNYVPEAIGRGEMLKRLGQFFGQRTMTNGIYHADNYPVLFFVLPLPCVDNSRYVDEHLLLQIMGSLGYEVQHRKHTSKLCYYLLRWTGVIKRTKFPKKKVRDGAGMNNFAIIVE